MSLRTQVQNVNTPLRRRLAQLRLHLAEVSLDLLELIWAEALARQFEQSPVEKLLLSYLQSVSDHTSVGLVTFPRPRGLPRVRVCGSRAVMAGPPGGGWRDGALGLAGLGVLPKKAPPRLTVGGGVCWRTVHEALSSPGRACALPKHVGMLKSSSKLNSCC